MTVNTIVFYKDRPMQIDGLLRSMRRYAPALWPPTVLYHYSPSPNARWNTGMGYEILREEHRDAWWLYRHPTVHKSLQNYLFTACNPNMALACLLVDDDLFYRPLPEFTVELGMAYAPRLGRNCVWCFNANAPQDEQSGDFTCHTSIDGHVYRTDEIMPRIAQCDFTIPSEMENQLGHLVPPFKLKYADHSCLVGIPHNRVQTMYDYPTGGGSALELNERFLAGERLDLDAMDFSDVRGSHQLIEYKFKKREALAA